VSAVYAVSAAPAPSPNIVCEQTPSPASARPDSCGCSAYDVDHYRFLGQSCPHGEIKSARHDTRSPHPNLRMTPTEPPRLAELVPIPIRSGPNPNLQTCTCIQGPLLSSRDYQCPINHF
jgi:hypothetical protein